MSKTKVEVIRPAGFYWLYQKDTLDIETIGEFIITDSIKDGYWLVIGDADMYSEEGTDQGGDYPLDFVVGPKCEYGPQETWKFGGKDYSVKPLGEGL